MGHLDESGALVCPPLPYNVRASYGTHVYLTGAADDQDERWDDAFDFIGGHAECPKEPETPHESDVECMREWAYDLLASIGRPYVHSNPDKKKKKGKKRKAKAEVAVPTGHDVNHWVNFVLYAVVGRMGDADGLMRLHGDGIRCMAKWMMAEQNVQVGVLYRGILVEPSKVDRHWLPHDPRLRFTSWSQEKEIACWFADPHSIISDFVRQRRPNVRGYLSSGKGEKKNVLWHHDWVDIPIPGDGRTLSLMVAAAMHPHIDQGQFLWNVQTQSEVIMDAPKREGTKIHVDPIEKADCGDVEELDARFTYPPFLTTQFGV